jgi:hypothetical protein
MVADLDKQLTGSDGKHQLQFIGQPARVRKLTGAVQQWLQVDGTPLTYAAAGYGPDAVLLQQLLSVLEAGAAPTLMLTAAVVQDRY